MDTLSPHEQKLHRTLIRELTKDELSNKVHFAQLSITIGQSDLPLELVTFAEGQAWSTCTSKTKVPSSGYARQSAGIWSSKSAKSTS